MIRLLLLIRRHPRLSYRLLLAAALVVLALAVWLGPGGGGA